ncbi:hypothetical protein [Changpingibacter yushuensis]|nr:hypothetical protein [Changpingibacter yushuensis]
MALDLARVVIELGGAGTFLLYVLWHVENDPVDSVVQGEVVPA